MPERKKALHGLRKKKISSSEALIKASHLLRHPPIPMDESSTLTPWVKGLVDMITVAGTLAQKRGSKSLCAPPMGEERWSRADRKRGRKGCSPPLVNHPPVDPPAPKKKKAYVGLQDPC